MKKSNKIVAVLLALVMIITAVPMMTASADVGGYGDAVKDENKHKHVYVIQSEKEGSCTEPAKTTFKCECGDVKVMETGEPAHIPAANGYKKKDDKVHTNYCVECKEVFEEAHKDYEVVVASECIEPTCAKAGKVVYQCTLCKGKRSETIKPIVHTPSGLVVKDDNKHSFTCSFCEKLIDEKHVWDEGHVDAAIKCGDSGKIIYTCLVAGCGKTKEETVPSACVYHEKEDIEKGLAPKTNNYDEKGHVFECIYCSKDKPDTHAFVVTYATETYETRGFEMLRMGSAAEVAAADDADDKSCATGNHPWGEEKVTKEPECKKTGSKEKVCTNCGVKVTTEIPATGICSYKWEITKQPTEMKDGEQVLKCKMCGNIKATEILEPLNPCAKGHDWSNWTVVKKATCAEAGEQNRKCKRVDCGVEETEVIPATDTHSFTPWETVEPAKCSTNGSKTRNCTVCGKVDVNVIPATGKHVGDWRVVSEPTLENPGREVKYCEECYKQVGERTIVYSVPTCKDTGVIRVTCKYCNYESFETVDTVDHKIDEDAKCDDYTISQHKAYCQYCGDVVKLNHTWGDWEVTVNATADKEGEKVRICTGCGRKETVKIPKGTGMLGDVNGDSSITAIDARLILQYVAGLREFTAKEMEAADVNADGNVTAIDARVILQVVAGLREI